MPVRHAIAKRRLFITGPFCEEVRFGVDDRGVYLGADVLKLEQLHGVIDLKAELDGREDTVFRHCSLPEPDLDKRDPLSEHSRNVADAIGQASLTPNSVAAKVAMLDVGVVAHAERAAATGASGTQKPRRSVREPGPAARALPELMEYSLLHLIRDGLLVDLLDLLGSVAGNQRHLG